MYAFINFLLFIYFLSIYLLVYLFFIYFSIYPLIFLLRLDKKESYIFKSLLWL